MCQCVCGWLWVRNRGGSVWWNSQVNSSKPTIAGHGARTPTARKQTHWQDTHTKPSQSARTSTSRYCVTGLGLQRVLQWVRTSQRWGFVSLLFKEKKNKNPPNALKSKAACRMGPLLRCFASSVMKCSSKTNHPELIHSLKPAPLLLVRRAS